MYDLTIRGGQIISAGGSGYGDLAVKDGRIAAFGHDIGRAAEVLDARDCLVLPSGVDMHVHLTPFRLGSREMIWVDDFATGSAAAAAGGITVIGNMTFPNHDEDLLTALKKTDQVAHDQSLVDYQLHPVLLEPTELNLRQIRELPKYGYCSIKIFMNLESFPGQEARFLRAMHEAGMADVLTMIHCEDHAIIEYCTNELLENGRRSLADYANARPPETEVAAVSRAISFARVTGAPLYVVHVASAAALGVIEAARDSGLEVYAEGRPIYFAFTRQKYAGGDAGIFVANPPLQEDSDIAKLWDAARLGRIATYCTDHAPWLLEDKAVSEAHDLENIRPGLADLETSLPFLFSRGVSEGRLSIERFVEMTSTNAARIFRMYPRKGTLAIGSDADIVVWDPNKMRIVDGAKFNSRAKHSAFDGMRLTGWPRWTVCRGQVVANEGVAVGRPGAGSRVARPAQ